MRKRSYHNPGGFHPFFVRVVRGLRRWSRRACLDASMLSEFGFEQNRFVAFVTWWFDSSPFELFPLIPIIAPRVFP